MMELRPRDTLTPLFIKAKETDEFEYCSTLLRIRGMEDAFWDPLVESYQLTNQLVRLIQAPLDDGLHLRLVLFLYCHLTEMDDLYNIVANLLHVTAGQRYSMTPLPIPKGTIPRGYQRNKRIDQLIALANGQGFNDVGRLFEKMYVRPVRNAFFHSDYILSPDSFNIRRGEGLNIDNVISPKIPLEWLMPRLELGINTSIAVMELLLEGIKSYKEDKIIRGRIGHNNSWMDIQLTTDREHGLTGFKSPPDEALKV